MACINQIKEYAEEKSYDKALALIREQDLSKSYNPQFLKICADVFLNTKHYEEARKVLMMAHRIAPEGNKVNFSIIRLYLETGERDLADEYFQQYEFNAFDGDEDLCWLRYMFARSDKDNGEKMLEAMMPLHTADMSDSLCYEFMRIYQLLGDTEKFEQEYSYLFDNFAESEYKEKAERLKKDQCAAEELYIYPTERILKRDPQVDAEEKELLERDYLRMNPKEPEIMVMADDYGADDDMLFFKRSTLDKWSIRKREMAEKRAEKKKAKEEAKRLKEAEREAKAAAMEEAAAQKEQEEANSAASQQVDDNVQPEVEETPVETVEEEAVEETPVETVEEEAVEETPVETVEEEAVEEIPVETVEEEAVEETPVETVEEVVEETPVETVEEEIVEETPAETVEEEAVDDVTIVETESVADIERQPFKDEMTEITTEEPLTEEIFASVEGAPGMTPIAHDALDVETVLREADSQLEAMKFEDDVKGEPDEEPVPDKHTQAFDEYDALLKREEEKLAEQFAMEEQLLLQAQSLLQSVESGVDDWNHKKRDNLFEAFDTETKRMTKTAKSEEIVSAPVDNVAEVVKPAIMVTESESETSKVEEKVADDTETPVASKVEEPVVSSGAVSEEPKPHIELREHIKAVLEIDATKKEILQKLKEGR